MVSPPTPPTIMVGAVKQKTVPVLYRCPKCKAVIRCQVEMREYPSGGRSFRLAPDIWISGPPLRDCETCRQPMLATAVLGKYNPNVPCGRKCREAVGSICRCACAGQNHGAYWERDQEAKEQR